MLLPLLLAGALLAPDVDARTNLGWVFGAKGASCTAACAGHGGCSTSRPGFAKNANDQYSDTFEAALLGAYGNNVGCKTNTHSDGDVGNCDRNAPADGQGKDCSGIQSDGPDDRTPGCPSGRACGTNPFYPDFSHARYASRAVQLHPHGG